jgi:hypothetical protein
MNASVFLHGSNSVQVISNGNFSQLVFQGRNLGANYPSTSQTHR